MSSTATATVRILRFGDFELDMELGELRKNGVATRLQEQPFRILLELLQRPGQVVTRLELRERLWPADTFVDFETSLNSAVRKLREALDDSAENPRFIETFKRRGYRFIGPIQPDASIPKRSRSADRMDRKWYWIAAVILVLAAAVIGSISVRRMRAPAMPPIDSIAVLPLDNLSRDSDQEEFAHGMTDALITDLAQIRDLRVISRTSVMQYKAVGRKSLPQIARELDVDAIVEGTVARSGSRVRVTAQLIHASTDRHVWAKSYERELGDIFALQGELAQAIADAVQVNVAPQVRAGLKNAPRFDRQAVDAYFEGMTAYKTQQTEDYVRGIQHLERAVAIEPEFALAHAAIARMYQQFAFTGPLAPLAFMPKAEAAARAAIKSDPRIAEAHHVLAVIHYRFHWNRRAAETEFRRALELSPGGSAVHRGYSNFLAAQERFDEAAVHKETARKLDPKMAVYLDAKASRTPAELERAVAAYRLQIERNPTTRGYFQLGSALVMNGQLVEGIKALEASDPKRHGRYLGYLGYAYARAGEEKRARAILDDLHVRSGGQYISSFAFALIHIGLGERDAAITRLEQAYRERAYELAEIKVTPAFEPLRDDPRFQNLVRKVGL